MMGEAGSEGVIITQPSHVLRHDVITMPHFLCVFSPVNQTVEQNDAASTSCLIYCNYGLLVGWGKSAPDRLPLVITRRLGLILDVGSCNG